MKKLMSKKKHIEGDTIEVTHGCSAIKIRKIKEKNEDSGAFTILCTIETHMFMQDLCNLGASTNLMIFSIYKNLIMDTPTPTSLLSLLEDWSIKSSDRILYDGLVMVEKFILSTDFMVLDCEMEQEVTIILGRLFLVIGRPIVDLELDKMWFRVHDDKVSFQICKTSKKPMELQVI
ncbi:uncharacterized protein LOC124894258 [Capsicum annuum]|uniref:uncharacterized protein LOC124894258 n=1 Tax=Capsicum annuum TaxID=4072 RepID=UPI001FB0FDE7|nr:uncharacterized protein LOC124894258 [Capsicum annuum]